MPFILFNFAYFSQICDEKNPQNDKSQVLIGIRKMQISYTIVRYPGFRSPGYCFGRWALLAESGWEETTRLEAWPDSRPWHIFDNT